jgi:hypothetical protein
MLVGVFALHPIVIILHRIGVAVVDHMGHAIQVDAQHERVGDEKIGDQVVDAAIAEQQAVAGIVRHHRQALDAGAHGQAGQNIDGEMIDADRDRDRPDHDDPLQGQQQRVAAIVDDGPLPDQRQTGPPRIAIARRALLDVRHERISRRCRASRGCYSFATKGVKRCAQCCAQCCAMCRIRPMSNQAGGSDAVIVYGTRQHPVPTRRVPSSLPT